MRAGLGFAIIGWVLLAGGLPPVAHAAEPSVAELVRTVRFDPHTKAARLAVAQLGKQGPAGWRALRGLVEDLAKRAPELTPAMAKALAHGVEPKRRAIAVSMYRASTDARIRTALALGLARAYPEHAELLHAHVAEGGAEAAPLFAALRRHDVPEAEALTFLANADLAHDVYAWLRTRDILPTVEHLAPLARSLAAKGRVPKACAQAAHAFVAQSNPDILHAVARLLASDDADLALGAHCFLLTVAGTRLPPDADQWRSWIDGRKGLFPEQAPVNAGTIEAAVRRGAHFLLRDLAPDGQALWRKGQSEVGATALVVLALRAAGVPSNDAAIEKAIRTKLLVFGEGDRPGVPAFKDHRETYNLALLAMALEAVDAKRFAVPLIALRDRLVGGQLEGGNWTYKCDRGTAATPGVMGDNSNTQYAALGLRAIERGGVPVGRSVWEKAARWWQTTPHEKGGWHYWPKRSHLWKRKISMTSAGIGSLAICLEGLHGKDAVARIQADPTIEKALHYLGELLLKHGYAGQELYGMFGVERAGVLTGTADFRSKFRAHDWYAQGAKLLLGTQRDDGAWGHPRARSDVQGSGYGFVVDTAYAILFLQKATQTAGPTRVGTVHVTIPKEKPPKTPRAVPKDPPAPTPVVSTPTPVLTLDDAEIFTNAAEVTIRGTMTAKDRTLTFRGGKVLVDGDGRFAVTVAIDHSQDIAFVTERDGVVMDRAKVHVERDVHPAALELLGGTVRAVGKQLIRLRASEPLTGVRTAQFFVPADAKIVDVPVELRVGKNTLLVTVFDRAGNETKARFEFEVRNRVLVLDGKSAVRIDLKEQPATFTLECWARGVAPTGTRALASNTEGAGMGLFWSSAKTRLPRGYVRIAKVGYLSCDAKKAWKWSRWSHLALSYDGTHARLFVNGKLQVKLEGGPYVPARRPLYIGAEPDGRNRPVSHFQGMIDEVRYSRGARYVKNFKPAKFHDRDADTLLLLHFDTDSATAFFDDSALGHAGRPYGAPRIVENKR